jgi:uncharacterized Zn-binding protein involved in type VI secretion
MARRAGRVWQDMAIGTVIGSLAPTVFINGTPVAVVGDPIAPHPKGGKHKRAVMATGSPNVFAHNISTCRDGDIATCTHPIIADSPDVFIN